MWRLLWAGAGATRWALRSTTRALGALVAVGLFLAVVGGACEPYDPPMCETHPEYRTCR